MRKGRALRYASLIALGGLLAATAISLSSFKVPERGSVDFYGHTVELDKSTSAAPVDIKHGCRLSALGVAPFRTTKEVMGPVWESAVRRSVLKMHAVGEAAIPVEVSNELVAKLRSMRSDATIAMGNTHGETTAGRVLFYPQHTNSYRMGERYAICKETIMRFQSKDRQEYARAYRIDHNGRTYWFGEFLACGNLARFFQAPPGWAPAPYPNADGGNPGVPPVVGNNQLREVPEPATLVLVSLGLVGLYATRTKKA